MPARLHGNIVCGDQAVLPDGQRQRRFIRLSADLDDVRDLSGGCIETLVGGVNGKQRENARDDNENQDQGDRYVHIALASPVAYECPALHAPSKVAGARQAPSPAVGLLKAHPAMPSVRV